MSFQRRVIIVSAAAVAIAIAIASLSTYLLVRNDIRRHVNHTLTTLASAFIAAEHAMAARPAGSPAQHSEGPPYPYAQVLAKFPDRPGDATNVVQLITSSATVYTANDGRLLRLPAPSIAAVSRLARAGTGSRLLQASVHGTNFALLAIAVAPGYAVVISHSTAESDSLLGELQLILIILTAAGVALATLLGWFVAHTALSPIKRLIAAVEHVAQRGDLRERIDERRRDELGSLARSFNSMLTVLDDTVQKLDDSARMQRRLVADASHELRTPVTSIRTNIEILERADELPAGERSALIADVVGQLEELSALINDLIELARDDEHIDAREEVRLDLLVAEAIDRARIHAPQARFEVSLTPTLVNGVPSRLDRAVKNLLDNAVKFAGTDAPIEVRLSDGELEIRDHGPGIDADELPHIFDRFFRGARSRALPGSGLGLAIVRQVAELHAGSVSAAAAADGGTIVRMSVPVVAWGR